MSIMTTIVLPSLGIPDSIMTTMSIMTTIVLPSFGIRSDVYNDNNCITFIRNSFRCL